MADTVGEAYGLGPSPSEDGAHRRASGGKKPLLSASRLLLLGGLVWLKRLTGGRT